MSQWVLKIQKQDGTVETEVYDEDEIGTMDDELTGLFIKGLEGVDTITIARQFPGWEVRK